MMNQVTCFVLPLSTVSVTEILQSVETDIATYIASSLHM